MVGKPLSRTRSVQEAVWPQQCSQGLGRESGIGQLGLDAANAALAALAATAASAGAFGILLASHSDVSSQNLGGPLPGVDRFPQALRTLRGTVHVAGESALRRVGEAPTRAGQVQADFATEAPPGQTRLSLDSASGQLGAALRRTRRVPATARPLRRAARLAGKPALRPVGVASAVSQAHAERGANQEAEPPEVPLAVHRGMKC